MSKKAQREEASKAKRVRKEEELKRQKKESRKKIILSSVIGVVAVTAIVLVFLFAPKPLESRTYANGNDFVRLYSDGTFTANLTHGVSKGGLYTESGESIIFAMNENGVAVNATGSIVNDVLTLPDEWDDGHGHGTKFTLK